MTETTKTDKPDKAELLKEAEDLLKLDDKEFIKAVQKTDVKRLYALSDVESLVTRVTSLLADKPDEVKSWKEEAEKETTEAEKSKESSGSCSNGSCG